MPEEDDSVLRTRAGDPVVVPLPSNRTTGFSWEVDHCDPELTCSELPYQKHPGGVGAGGVQEFRITVSRPGEFAIRFRLKRPWESKARKLRSFRIAATA